MASIEIKNIEEIRGYLTSLPESIYKDARKVFAKAVLAADKETKQNVNARTGALRRSIGQGVSGSSLETLRASVFSGSSGGDPIKYAPLHEYGGTVKAKKAYSKVPGGPYLNIPVEDNLTASGVQRMTPRMVFSNDESRLFKSKGGRWVITLGDKLMFVLIKEVTIKPSLGMRRSTDRQVPIILSELQDLIGE